MVARIQDREVGRLWARHYPRWQQLGASRALCMAIALILQDKEDKAQSIATEDDLIDKLHDLLNLFGLPKDQFYEIEKEVGDV